MIRVARLALITALFAVAAGAPARADVIHAGEREVVALSDADIRDAIAAMQELRALGKQYRPGQAATGGPGGPAAEATPETSAILARHGFTEQRFADVGYSIGIALAALRMNPDDLAGSTERQAAMLKEMLPGIPAEQQAHLQRALRALEQMRDQPAANLALVKRYRSELERVLGP